MGRGAEDTRQNFALYSARPGTWQQMPVFSTSAPTRRRRRCEAALAFTREDQVQAAARLPGDGHSTSTPAWSPRLQALGGLDVRLHDFDAMKAAGINIFGADRRAAAAASAAAAATPTRG